MQVNGTSPQQASAYSYAERPEDTVRRSTKPKDVSASPEPSRPRQGEGTQEAVAADSSSTSTTRVDRVVDLANELAQRLDIQIQFRKSKETDEFRLEVVDRETGEVIRRVPPDEMVAHLENFSGFEGLLTGDRR